MSDNLDVAGCRFERCRMGSAMFKGTDAAWTRFETCDPSNVDFSKARIANASLVGCKLLGLRFSPNGSMWVTFRDCRLINACVAWLSLKIKELVGLDFDVADLSSCDFPDAVFDGCSPRGATIANANFVGPTWGVHTSGNSPSGISGASRAP